MPQNSCSRSDGDALERFALLDDALTAHAARTPDADALIESGTTISYAALALDVTTRVTTLARLGVAAGDRVAVFATKQIDVVATLLAIMRIGAIAVPINPALKPSQITHILSDSGATVFAGPYQRLCRIIAETSLPTGVSILTPTDQGNHPESSAQSNIGCQANWRFLDAQVDGNCADPIVPSPSPASAAAILYTSGSTATPKGVVLSGDNLARGAASVASYLGNRADDRILALMPLSFDYGLSQITTALTVGACAVLHDYLVPRGVISAVIEHRVTGLPAVPHLWNQLATLEWPPVPYLRYVTNTGGRQPVETTHRLQQRLPDTDIYLMYGFTEAFRSTRLPPEEVAHRPASIGVAIPDADVLVVHPDGRECAPGEVGELIHSGPLVAQGYWGDKTATAHRFRPRFSGATADTDIFAWSGDLARRDEDGFLYFVSRREDMAKLHGYRVNPAEIEVAIRQSDKVLDACVVCLPHPTLGQAAVAVVVAHADDLPAIEAVASRLLPRFMLPERFIVVEQLPAGPNQKVDRQALKQQCSEVFGSPELSAEVAGLQSVRST